MKKAMCIPLLLFFIACGDGQGVENNSTGNELSGDTIDSTPSAIDTAQHPNGMTNGSVISRDTAAMRADTNARP
jgi:hypothetical protein